MATKSRIIIATVALLLSAAAVVVWEHLHEESGHHHHHGEELVQTAPPPDTARWQSDAQLQASMVAIRDGVAAAAGNAESAVKLPQLIDGQIDLIVRNCRLAPEADAALHTVLAGLARGAQQAAEPSTRGDGLTLLRSALNDYPRYFDHPNWQPLP